MAGAAAAVGTAAAPAVPKLGTKGLASTLRLKALALGFRVDFFTSGAVAEGAAAPPSAALAPPSDALVAAAGTAVGGLGAFGPGRLELNFLSSLSWFSRLRSSGVVALDVVKVCTHMVVMVMIDVRVFAHTWANGQQRMGQRTGGWQA